MNKTFARIAASALLLAFVAGCSTPVKLDEVPVESRSVTPSAAAASGADAAKGNAAQSQVTNVSVGQTEAEAAAAAAARAGNTVYFDFDSFVVRDDARPVIEAHAKALRANARRKLAVEGHTDERGGREYNLALGQKRAEAVVRAITLLGAKESQMVAVSFGKERPAVAGSNEEAWAKNRRAELRSEQ
jgi:peptidoglycan-associated lipoprotein